MGGKVGRSCYTRWAMNEVEIHKQARLRMMADMTGNEYTHHLIGVVQEAESDAIAEWLRSEVAMTTAGSGNEFVFNCLADAIQRGAHRGGKWLI